MLVNAYMKNKTIFLIFILFLALFVSKNTYACEGLTDCVQNISTPGLKAEYSTGFIGKLITNIIPIVLSIAGFFTVIFIVISGLQYVLSSGNPESAAKAQGRLIYAIIGFVIIILAFGILRVVDSIFLNSGVV